MTPSTAANLAGSGQEWSDPLAAAVQSTIAYSDLFGFPPAADEIHRYLHGVPASFDDVTTTLNALTTQNCLITDGRCFALPGRDHFFEQRHARNQIAAELWPKARRYGAALASIPTVRMVGVTGSLAVDNTGEGADIDFMVVVDGGTVWRTRALLRTIEVADHRFGGNICVNYLLSERALQLTEECLYVAHELSQMVVLYGAEIYEGFRRQNEWTHAFLPNAMDSSRPVESVKPSRLVRSTFTPIMRSLPARKLEDWECERKLHRYNQTDFQRGKFSEYTREATGHRLHVRDEIELTHASRLHDSNPARPLRLLFGQSYHLIFDPKLWREMRPYPPLGSLYGAAVAREAGFDVRFYDSMLATGNQSWRMALDRHRPDVVVLFEDNFNYLTKMCLLRMRDAAVEMIEAARRIGARVIVCGSDPSDHADLYLQAGAEFVVRGEGEQALLRLLTFIDDAEDANPSEVPGVSYLRNECELVENVAMPAMRALNEVPFPAWDLVDLKQYRNLWHRHHGMFSINLVTTRGCPYHCNWCAKPIWGQRYNTRSPENVVAELAHLSESLELDHVWFMDDIFGLKPGWVQRFADCLQQQSIGIRFKCLTRADLLRRPGEIEALAKAGCETVWIGAESGSQKILDAMEKGTRVEEIEEMSARLKSHGIRVGHFIQFGYPGESWRDIRQTLRMIRRVLPDELGVSVSYPLPGTPFYERVQAQLGETQNWQDSDDLAMLFRGPYTTAFYRRLHSFVHKYLAWNRTLGQLRDGSFLRLSPLRLVRRLARFGIYSAFLPLSWLRLGIIARRGDQFVDELPTALDRKAAATPSGQDTA